MPRSGRRLITEREIDAMERRQRARDAARTAQEEERARKEEIASIAGRLDAIASELWDRGMLSEAQRLLDASVLINGSR